MFSLFKRPSAVSFGFQKLSQVVCHSNKITKYTSIFINYRSRKYTTQPEEEQDVDEEDPEPIPTPAIPRHKIDVSFSTSSGPGGQNVNKLSTKAEIRFKIDEADWIPESVRERLRKRQHGRINKDGEFSVVSQRFRFQDQNLKDCFDKLEEFLKEACIVPKKRKATKPPAYAKENRLQVLIKLYKIMQRRVADPTNRTGEESSLLSKARPKPEDRLVVDM
jgi:protein subunit release factor B